MYGSREHFNNILFPKLKEALSFDSAIMPKHKGYILNLYDALVNCDAVIQKSYEVSMLLQDRKSFAAVRNYELPNGHTWLGLALIKYNKYNPENFKYKREAIEYLLDMGANVTKPFGPEKETTLNALADLLPSYIGAEAKQMNESYAEIAQKFFDKGFDPDATNINYLHPTKFICEKLVQIGANFFNDSMQNIDAAEYLAGLEKFCKVLQDNGVDFDFANKAYGSLNEMITEAHREMNTRQTRQNHKTGKIEHKIICNAKDGSILGFNDYLYTKKLSERFDLESGIRNVALFINTPLVKENYETKWRLEPPINFLNDNKGRAQFNNKTLNGYRKNFYEIYFTPLADISAALNNRKGFARTAQNAQEQLKTAFSHLGSLFNEHQFRRAEIKIKHRPDYSKDLKYSDEFLKDIITIFNFMNEDEKRFVVRSDTGDKAANALINSYNNNFKELRMTFNALYSLEAFIAKSDSLTKFLFNDSSMQVATNNFKADIYKNFNNKLSALTKETKKFVENILTSDEPDQLNIPPLKAVEMSRGLNNLKILKHMFSELNVSIGSEKGKG
jgi:hypothetical protein